MKIQILKSANTAKTYAACPMMVDLPPDGDSARKTAQKK